MLTLPLRQTGAGENYDYVHFVPALARLGHEVSLFDSGDRSLHADFALNTALLERVVAFQPDVILRADALRDLVRYAGSDPGEQARADRQLGHRRFWKFAQASRFFADHVDLHVTTDLAAEDRVDNLNSVMLSQWAASGMISGRRARAECRHDVSFVGSMYGYRAAWIETMRRAEFLSHASGWHGKWRRRRRQHSRRIFRTSRISLNFAGAGQNPGHTAGANSRQIKARTFRVPGAGGFLLTETAPGLGGI